jgi:hypothetical protein
MGKKICEITNRLHQKRHGLEHLKEFVKFYLANLVLCQLLKGYVK